MKKRLFIPIYALSLLFLGRAEGLPSAEQILDAVRQRLPQQTVHLIGSLRVKAKNGYVKSNQRVQIDLELGSIPPKASYAIGDPGSADQQTLSIVWDGTGPSYELTKNGTKVNTLDPTADIMETGVSWADLSFSALWWENPKLIDTSRKINRPCYVIDIPVPDTPDTMRLWIDQKDYLLLEAQTLEGGKKPARRMRIKSIKKFDELWVAKDLEIMDMETRTKTLLQISDMEVESHANTQPPQSEPLPDIDALVDGNNRFTLELYRQLGGTNNLFCSPYSVSSVMAMVYSGARGKTAEQMEETFHFPGQTMTPFSFQQLTAIQAEIQQKGNVELASANSLWPQQEFDLNPDYLALTREFYQGHIETLDYQTQAELARQTINQWTEEQTNHKIQDLIQKGALGALTRLVLVNAIYFKGNWAQQFAEKATHESPFTLHDGTTVTVPMMMQTGSFKHASSDHVQVLELPYEGDDLSMLIFLPNDPDGLPALEEQLSPEWIDTLDLFPRELNIQLPRFKLETSYQLGPILSRMGIPLAFSDRADFSGMTAAERLLISQVIHKGFIEVNEEGTEAAAATATIVRTTSMPSLFHVHHPFLFLIRENNTGSILFIGRVMDPSS